MPPIDDLGFIHKWVPAESGSRNPVTLLLLYGTEDDTEAVLPAGNELWPGAAVLGVRTKVLENATTSSPRKSTDAGIADIKSRTEELAQFIGTASKRYGFSRRRLIVVGYANGANLAASLILLHPHYLAAAVLFRAVMPLVPNLIRDFSHLSVFIGAARPVSRIPSGPPEELAAIFESGGADVTISWRQSGQELGEDEIRAAKHWLAREDIRRNIAA